MILSRAYDDAHGQPVVVLVVNGTHDVSRLVNTLAGSCPVVEQLDAAQRIRRQVRRHAGGRLALELLAAHGGPDFTGDEAPVWILTTLGHPDPLGIFASQEDARAAAIDVWRRDNAVPAATFKFAATDDIVGSADELVALGHLTGYCIRRMTVCGPHSEPDVAGAGDGRG